jgi:hypothetical protein
MIRWCILAIITVFTCSLQAKTFRNAYLSFELPPTWNCVLEQTEWVCHSEMAKEAKQAVIILTAKEKGSTDSFEQYTAHLNTPRVIPGLQNEKVQSKIFHVKQVKIKDQAWVDGWHQNSEVINYYTRYLATIKDKIAILVTFSAHKKFYTQYSQDFFNAISSLTVIASANLLRGLGKNDLDANRGGTLGVPSGPIDGTLTDVPPPVEEEGGSWFSGKKRSKTIFLVIVVLSVIGVVLFKMKKR